MLQEDQEEAREEKEEMNTRDEGDVFHDCISDSSNNESIHDILLSQEYIISSLHNHYSSSYDREDQENLDSSQSSSSLPSSLAINHNEFQFTFLKVFKKYLHKFTKYQKVRQYLEKSRRSPKNQSQTKFVVNEKVRINLPKLVNQECVILKTRKRNYYYVRAGDKKYVLPGGLLLPFSQNHSSSINRNNHPQPAPTSTQSRSTMPSYPEYNVGDLVFVERRCWIGINKEGGVGKITCRHEPVNLGNDPVDSDEEKEKEKDQDYEIDLYPSYDVTYVLGGKEQRVPTKYISLKRFEEVTNKSRTTLGRCSIPGCFSFVCDCKHDQQQKHIETIIQNINRGQLKSKPTPQFITIPPEKSSMTSKARKRTPQNLRNIPVRGIEQQSLNNHENTTRPSHSKPSRKNHHESRELSESETSDSDNNEDNTFIQREGTIVPPDIQQYVNRKLSSRNESEQLNYLSEICLNLKNCEKKINKYGACGQKLQKQFHQIANNPNKLQIWMKEIKSLRRRYQKYLVNSHRKYIDVGNLIARKFENKLSSSLKRQFILVEAEFSEMARVVEARGIEIRKKIELIEDQCQNFQEISFADEETNSDESTNSVTYVTEFPAKKHVRRIVEDYDDFIVPEDDLYFVENRRDHRHKRKKISPNENIIINESLMEESPPRTYPHPKEIRVNTHKFVEILEKVSNCPLLSDKLYSPRPDTPATNQLENRIAATSFLDSLMDIHQTPANGPSLEILLSLIPTLFYELSNISTDSTKIQEFTSKLFVIEVIWQQYAVRNESICEMILEYSDQLEQLLLIKSTPPPLSHSCTSSDPINIFSFLRRKVLWLRLMRHMHHLMKDSIDSHTNLIELPVRAEEKIWCIVFHYLIRFGASLLTSSLLSVPFNLSTLAETHPLWSDLILSLITLTSPTFQDNIHLASTAHTSPDVAATSEIQFSLWSIFNFHLFQSLANFQTNNSISFPLFFYERNTTTKFSTDGYCIPSFLGKSLLSIQSSSMARIDASVWSSILLFTWIQLKSTKNLTNQDQSIAYASLPSNWPLIKELTKDLNEFSTLTLWLLRISQLLPLWDNCSNGYDIFRELLARLLKLELPWSLPKPFSSLSSTFSSSSTSSIGFQSLTNQILLIIESYQSHHIDNSQTPLFILKPTDFFVSSTLFHLFSHYSSSVGIPPPRYSIDADETMGFGESILPYALVLFEKGFHGIPPDSISFKRIQNRLSTLPLLCKETSSLAAAICLISLLKCSINLFGSNFYSESIHQTLVNIISNPDIYLEEERQYLSWYSSLILFLPSQCASHISTTLGRLSFSYLFSKFQTILEQNLSGITKTTDFMDNVVALTSVLPLIDGIHTSRYSSTDESNENRIRMIFSLWNGTIRKVSVFENGLELRLCFCGLNRLFSNITIFLHSNNNSMEQIRLLITCIFSMFRDILPVLRELLINCISNCLKSGSKFHENFNWQCGLLLSRILARVYWILGTINDPKLPHVPLVDLFRSPTVIPPDDYPIDLWFKCCFWSELVIQCESGPQRDNSRFFAHNDNVFIVWIGCLPTLFLDPLVFHDIRFWDLHQFLLKEEFLLQNKPLDNTFVAYSRALSCAKSFTAFPQMTVSLSECHSREDILSLLSYSYQLLHSFLMSCVVSTYTRSVSDRSHSKDIFRPIIEVLERAKSYVTHRHSRVGSIFEYPCIFACHLLSGWIGGSLLMPLSQTESLSKMCELPLAFANSLEDFLLEHGASTTPRDEPKPSHILFLLNLPHLVCGISFFSFSTRIFQCWKPFLRILCTARISSNHTVRSFLTRSWTLSLIERKIPFSFLSRTVPNHWSNEFHRSNYFLFSVRSSDFSQYHLFSNLCIEKLKVFREYVLTSDSLWMDAAVGVNSKTAVIATRTDLILDFLTVYCRSMDSIAPNDTMLNLIPNGILSTLLYSLRIVVYLLGYPMDDVIGTTADSGSDCLNSCLNNFLNGSSLIELINHHIPNSLDSSIHTWRLFQQSFLNLILQHGFGSESAESTRSQESKEIYPAGEVLLSLCSEVRVLITRLSQSAHHNSPHLSISLKEECHRMVTLIDEKVTHSLFHGLIRSISTIPSSSSLSSSLCLSPELLEKCRQLCSSTNQMVSR